MYEPLYKRVRPVDIDEFVGQEHILAEGKPLRIIIEKDAINSLIFYGPPGIGKTLLAEIIANRTRSNFIKISAVNSGISELKKVAQEAHDLRRWGKSTILFIDEIHRFNKPQQDFLLPLLEEGTIRVIGASTENPIFALTKALISRTLIFEFKPLSKTEIKKILKKASEKEKIKVEDAVLDEIAIKAAGDARKALMLLEIVANYSEGEKTIKSIDIANILNEERSLSGYDEQEHYDIISAFIKSIRGSDPDAALFWLENMLTRGEDPLYITRRLMILAAEDIGLADPLALVISESAHQAINHVGMPEAELILAMATIYLSCAPKSNSCYIALKKAKDEVEKIKKIEVPVHLADKMSFSKKSQKAKYLYPHDYKGGFVKQIYKPTDTVYYHPKEIGREKEIKKRLKELWGERYP